MAKLNTPDRFRAGVFAISRLDDSTVQAIRESLDHKKSSDLSAAAKNDDMVVSAVSSAVTVKPEDFRLVTEAVVALYGVRSAREETVEEFADQVSDALASVPEQEFRLPDSQRADFKQKLITLLSAELFTVASRVRGLTNEYERTFCHARIVTDLRPVFGLDVSDGPQAMLIVHNMRLAYHEGGSKTKDFYDCL